MPGQRGNSPPRDELSVLQKKCAEQAKQIEHLLLKEAMFDSILSFLPEHIYFKDTKSRFIALGQAMKQWFGAKSKEEVIGKSDFDLFSNEHAQQAFTDEQAILASGNAIKEKVERETWEDGHITWVSTYKAPIRDFEGTIIGTFGISRDITQQRLADERLQEATRTIWDERNLLQTVIDLVPDAIYVKDDNHQFVLSNRTHYSMLGKSNESAIIGKSEDDFYDAETVLNIEAQEDNVIKNNQSLIHAEEKRIHPVTRKPIWLSTSKVALRNYKLNGVVCVSRDISDIKQVLDNLKNAKNDAEIANQVKSEFLAKMSHEIRTPLNGIIGLTQCLIDSPDSINRSADLHTIKGSAEVLLQIIDDVLDFSKLETGALPLEQKPFNLRTMIEDLMDIVFYDFENNEIERVCIIDENVPNRLFGDTGKLRQILLNMLINAKKFTQQGFIVLRVITIRTEKNSVKIKFSIEDSGIGISENQKERIFFSFSQADDSMTRKYGGTGLGLAITQKLAKLMGSEIQIESPTKKIYFQKTGGPGSTFFFITDFSTPSKNPEEAPKPQLENKNILILACSEPTQESVSFALQAQKINIRIAFNNTQAASLISLNNIDAFITERSFALRDLSQTMQTYLSQNRKPVILLTQKRLSTDSDTETLPFPYKLLNKPIRRTYLLEALTDMLHTTDPQHSKSSDTATDRSSLQIVDSPFEKLKRMASNKKILLVEDNPVNQQVAVASLERVGIHVDIAENGRRALDSLSQKDYDLILMDLQMPIMDGLTATREIRKMSHHKNLPIIALTAQAMKGDLESCLEAGMNDYISKPIKAQHFYKILYQWLINPKESAKQ